MTSLQEVDTGAVLARVSRATLLVTLAALGLSCRSPIPREIVPGIVRPEARFEVAPEVGERFPDVTIHDAEGNPVRILELAARKPHTVLTLGCLT